MTTITIERALLEQVQDLLYRVTRWKGENHEVLTDLHDIKEAVKAVLAASATAPAWNNVPTVPGVWVNRVSMRAMEIDASVLKAWGKADVRWFGPIPPDGDKP